MAPYMFVETNSGVVGVMPSGEVREFPTESEYWQAYRAEEDEIADEMYRLDNERQIELPEDWPANDWLVWA